MWAIDPTVLITSAGEYLVYSSWDGDLQCLYISWAPIATIFALRKELKNDYRQFTSATTVGSTVQISCPTNSWEQVGGNTDEGPGKLISIRYDYKEDFSKISIASLYHGGKTWIICESYRWWATLNTADLFPMLVSASSCATSSYSLGQLELTGSNPLSASSWFVYLFRPQLTLDHI